MKKKNKCGKIFKVNQKKMSKEEIFKQMQQLMPLIKSAPPEKRKQLLKMLHDMKEEFDRIKFDE